MDFQDWILSASHSEAKFIDPSPDCFIGNIYTALHHGFLDISETQDESDIKPDSPLDDVGMEAVPSVN